MSLEFVEMKDALLSLDDNKPFTLQNDGSEILFQNFSATSSYPINSSSVSITCNPSDEKTFVDPKIYVKAQFAITVYGTIGDMDGGTGATDVPENSAWLFDVKSYKPISNGVPASLLPNTGNVNNSILSGMNAPRFMPFSSIMSNLTYSMNSTNYSTTLSEYFEPMLRTSFTRDMFNEFLSTCPTMQDNVQNYSDYLSATPGNANNSTYGSYVSPNSSVFAIKGTNTYMDARGAWVLDSATSVISGGNWVNQYKFTTFEPLFITPLWTSTQALTRLRTLVFQFNFGDFERAFSSLYAKGNSVYTAGVKAGAKLVGGGANSIAPLADITNLANISADFSVYLRQIKAKSFEKVPKIINYRFNDMLILSTSANFSDYGQPKQATINTTNLQGIPKQIIVYARAQTSLQKYYTADTYARITKVNVQYGTRNGLLNSLDERQLYQLSVSRGLQMTWNDWQKYIGSIFLLDVAKDIGLPDGYAPGVQSNPAFSITVDLLNINQGKNLLVATPPPLAYTLYCIVIYDGIMQISEDGAIQQYLNVINNGEAIKVQNGPAIVGGRRKKYHYNKKEMGMYGGYHYIQNPHNMQNMSAGSLLGGLKVKKYRKGKKHQSVKNEIMKMKGKSLLGGKKKKAKSVGGKRKSKRKVGGKRKVNKKRGAGLFGGTVIERETLKNMAEDLSMDDDEDYDDESEYSEEEIRGGSFKNVKTPIKKNKVKKSLKNNSSENVEQWDAEDFINNYGEGEEFHEAYENGHFNDYFNDNQ
jgi:hypothetical protein